MATSFKLLLTNGTWRPWGEINGEGGHSLAKILVGFKADFSSSDGVGVGVVSGVIRALWPSENKKSEL